LGVTPRRVLIMVHDLVVTAAAVVVSCYLRFEAPVLETRFDGLARLLPFFVVYAGFVCELAELACDIEMNRLGEAVGKQDQYIAAYGGLTCFTFNPGGRVDAEPLGIPMDALFNLEDNLLLFFTGFSRSAGRILSDQKARSEQGDAAMLKNLHDVKELGLRSRQALMAGDTAGFGALMHEQWEQKKRRSGGMTNPQIDDWYDTALRHGAIGGKLVGAGGGGFLLFYSEDHRRVRAAMAGAGLEEVRFRFDFEGTKVLLA
jgi:D-glycero-alpha-D-manno-heptose-7-phosphate kinase